MPSRARAAVLPLSWTFTLNPLDSRWRIQSLQQPQVGAFQTSTGSGVPAAPAGTMFDSSVESDAKEGDIHNPQRTYEPLTYTQGRGQLIPVGIDRGPVVHGERSSGEAGVHIDGVDDTVMRSRNLGGIDQLLAEHDRQFLVNREPGNAGNGDHESELGVTLTQGEFKVG